MLEKGIYKTKSDKNIENKIYLCGYMKDISRILKKERKDFLLLRNVKQVKGARVIQQNRYSTLLTNTKRIELSEATTLEDALKWLELFFSFSFRAEPKRNNKGIINKTKPVNSHLGQSLVPTT
ncbi:CLUMA_CG018532, isoform A [Clunio marinus]|uniref:CLUMA_CG018532, isoform A n=1 Tax=Clunio marinus TaxID=568069 RepID=A0A1J1IXQ3_9DIPT|nr:CLUMA_CG018532, isoform A [Clunio marinus]